MSDNKDNALSTLKVFAVTLLIVVTVLTIIFGLITLIEYEKKQEQIKQEIVK